MALIDSCATRCFVTPACIVASSAYSASSYWYAKLQPQPVDKRASTCVYNLGNYVLWLPRHSPTRSQKTTDWSTDSQISQSTQQVTRRNLLQEPGYNERRNKREPTSSNLTCHFQNYPIISDHVPNRSNIPFSISAIQISSTKVLARRLIGTCAGCTQNYWSHNYSPLTIVMPS